MSRYVARSPALGKRSRHLHLKAKNEAMVWSEYMVVSVTQILEFHLLNCPSIFPIVHALLPMQVYIGGAYIINFCTILHEYVIFVINVTDVNYIFSRGTSCGFL
jgi:hypothetical protein